jgi:flagellar motor component MotA
MSKTQEVFRNAVQENQIGSGEYSKIGSPTYSLGTYKTLMNKVIYSTIGWAFITTIMTFLFLYFLNPPISQQKKTDNDLTKPSPNITIISILSLLAGIAVFILVNYVNKNNQSQSHSRSHSKT